MPGTRKKEKQHLDKISFVTDVTRKGTLRRIVWTKQLRHPSLTRRTRLLCCSQKQRKKKSKLRCTWRKLLSANLRVHQLKSLAKRRTKQRRRPIHRRP